MPIRGPRRGRRRGGRIRLARRYGGAYPRSKRPMRLGFAAPWGSFNRGPSPTRRRPTIKVGTATPRSRKSTRIRIIRGRF